MSLWIVSKSVMSPINNSKNKLNNEIIYNFRYFWNAWYNISCSPIFPYALYFCPLMNSGVPFLFFVTFFSFLLDNNVFPRGVGSGEWVRFHWGWCQNSISVWIQINLAFAFCVLCFSLSLFFFFCSAYNCWQVNYEHALFMSPTKWHFLTIFSLKMGLITLFTHLKIISLQCF